MSEPVVYVKRVVQKPYSFLFPPGTVIKRFGNCAGRTAVIDKAYVVNGERYYDIYGRGWEKPRVLATSVEGAWNCCPRPVPFLSRETHAVVERTRVDAPVRFVRYFQLRNGEWNYSFFGPASGPTDLWECEVTPLRRVR